MNMKHGLVLSHKWKMSKKSSIGARILNFFRVFYLFCLGQAFLTEIPTFSSILRVLSIHYDMKKSFGKLTAEGLEDSKDLGKKKHAVITCVDLAAYLSSLPLRALASARNAQEDCKHRRQ